MHTTSFHINYQYDGKIIIVLVLVIQKQNKGKRFPIYLRDVLLVTK